ncbi:putative monooxygenase [Atractiella rhizophila]|nr:putative monooxygenase [Atractiella rhizophila]
MDSVPISPVAQNLRIIILGSGIAGLSTALALARRGFKDITVIEQARDLTFVGVGIQVAPNMARLLDRMKVWDSVLEDAVEMKATSIRRGTTGESLADLNLPNIRAKYGYPHMVAHRASLIDALYRPLITEYAGSVRFILNHRVGDVDFDKVSIFAFNREGNKMTIDGDVIIAADGIKSKARYLMLRSLGEEDKTIDTGTAAYRITIPREKMLADPELRKLIDSNTVYRWIGTRRYILGYPIHRNTLFNISTAHPDINFAQSDNWTSTGTKAGMKKVFADYCELIHKLLDLAPDDKICEWKLVMHGNLRSWVHGNVALAGDACHATLPHLAQGAAQAIEDGAVIAACLARVKDKKDIHKCLKVYERVRKTRAEEMLAKAVNSGKEVHLVMDTSLGGQRDDRGRRVNVGGDVNTDKVSDQWVFPSPINV